MSKTNFSKSGKVTIRGLSQDEYYILTSILNRVKEIMQYDEDLDEFTDHDNFLYSLSEDEYKILMGIQI